MKPEFALENNATVALRILQNHAPDEAVRKLCTDLLFATPHAQRERVMILAIADGLLYGNWIWTKPEFANPNFQNHK